MAVSVFDSFPFLQFIQAAKRVQMYLYRHITYSILIVKNWRQSKQMFLWKYKLWHIQAMVYCEAVTEYIKSIFDTESCLYKVKNASSKAEWCHFVKRYICTYVGWVYICGHMHLYRTCLDRYIKLLHVFFGGLGELLFGGLNNFEHFVVPTSKNI